jgi:hypothetical protein
MTTFFFLWSYFLFLSAAHRATSCAAAASKTIVSYDGIHNENNFPLPLPIHALNKSTDSLFLLCGGEHGSLHGISPNCEKVEASSEHDRQMPKNMQHGNSLPKQVQDKPTAVRKTTGNNGCNSSWLHARREGSHRSDSDPAHRQGEEGASRSTGWNHLQTHQDADDGKRPYQHEDDWTSHSHRV